MKLFLNKIKIFPFIETYEALGTSFSFCHLQRPAVMLPSLRLLPSIAMDSFIALLAANILILAFFAGLSAGWPLFFKIFLLA